MSLMYVAAALVAVAIVFIVLAAFAGSSGPTGVAKSLLLLENVATQKQVVKSELPARDRLLLPFLDRAKALAVRLSPRGTNERLAQLLERAGSPVGWTVERLFGVKGIGLLLGLILGLLLEGLSLSGIVWGLGLAAFGFYLPDILVYNVGVHRREDTAKGLADALDMLTVCVEAGQGFDSALLQVARNVEGPVAGEFARVLSEIQIGKSRAEAFAAMGERIPLPTVKNFTSSLVQADRLGIPIASVLREQTAAMRVARRQQAEEKAQKVTIKILFPVMFCIFPALFVVVLGPGVIRMIETLTGL